MNFYEWTALLAACVVFLIVVVGVVSAVRDNAKDRRVDRLTELADAREHELALADREVVMWQAALAHPTPIFSARRSQPVLVGRSQVLDVFHSGGSRALKSRPGWPRQAQQDMPIPVSDDPSPKVPPPPALGSALADAQTGDTEVMAEAVETQPCARLKPHLGHMWRDKGVDQWWWCEGIEEAKA